MGRVADSKRARGTRSAAAYALAALLLTACAALEGGPAASTSHEVVGYYPGWVAPRFAPTPEHIAARNLTVVNYAFLDICWRGRHGNPAEGGMRDCSAAAAAPASDPSPDAVSAAAASTAAVPPDGALVLGAPELDAVPGLDNLAQLVRLKESNPRLRLMASVGGWTWSNRFSDMAASAATRRNFIDSSIAFLRGRQFDGIDIDWEYPGGGGQSYNTVDSVNDKHNYTLLMAEFRAQLDAQGSLDGKRYALTAAIGAGTEKIAQTEPALYSQYMDWVNVMSYDFHGAWESSTNFHAPLYHDSADPSTGVLAKYNINDAVTALVAAGMPRNKILLGVPFYGRGWKGVGAGPTANGLYQAASGPAPGLYEAGIEDYKVLKDKAGTRWYHPVTKQLFLFTSGGEWWSYDDPTVISTKMQYVRDQSLRGAFSWELDGDASGALTSEVWKGR